MGVKYQGSESDEFYDQWNAITGAWALRGEHDLAPVIHECADGHAWREQPDGGVSPSYGLALTSIKFDGWNPRTCPEPERFDAPDDPPYLPGRGLKCPDCGEIRCEHDYLPGCSSQPWLHMERYKATGHVCPPPAPVCGKPTVKSARWQKARLTGAEGKPYIGHTWVPVEDLTTTETPDGQLGLMLG